MSTHNSANKEQDRQAAEERFRMGTGEYTEGRLEQAEISLGNAERFFYLLGDFQRAADGPGASEHRPAGLRLAARGRLRASLRR